MAAHNKIWANILAYLYIRALKNIQIAAGTLAYPRFSLDGACGMLDSATHVPRDGTPEARWSWRQSDLNKNSGAA